MVKSKLMVLRLENALENVETDWTAIPCDASDKLLIAANLLR